MKDLEAKNIMYLQKKLIWFHWVLTLKKDYNQKMQQSNIHMEQIKKQFTKKEEIKCLNIIGQ